MPKKPEKIERDTSGTAQFREQSTKPSSQPKGDSTARVSLKPSDAQAGPNEKDLTSKKKSTSTKGSKESGSASRAKRGTDEWPHGKPAEEQIPTAAETAAKQPIRKDDRPAPAETHKIKGEEVDVVATPMRVDPIELKPSKRDTLTKDQLRNEGNSEAADAPVTERKGGDWVDQDVKLT